MTEQEKINNEVQMKLALQDARFDSFMKSMEDFKKEMKDFKDEMRQQNIMRANEVAEIRNSVQSMQQSLMEMQTSNRHQNVLVIIGVAAMVVAVILK